MMLMQLEMYQLQPQQQQQQPSSTAVIYTASGQPVTYTVASTVCESYNSRQSVACGVILITTGVLSIMFNVAAMTQGEILSFIGQGIWCAALVGKIYCRLCL